MLASLTLLAGLALAASDDPPLDYRGGARLGRAGVVLTGIGMSATGLGTMSLAAGMAGDSDGAMVVGVLLLPQGVVATLTGIPLLTAGSLRSARAVEAAGGHVSQAPGVASVALGTGALALSVTGLADGWWFDERIARFGPVTGVLLGGSVACGMVQVGMSRRAGEALGLHLAAETYRPREDLPELWLRVTPAPVGGHPGLVIGGGF